MFSVLNFNKSNTTSQNISFRFYVQVFINWCIFPSSRNLKQLERDLRCFCVFWRGIISDQSSWLLRSVTFPGTWWYVLSRILSHQSNSLVDTFPVMCVICSVGRVDSFLCDKNIFYIVISKFLFLLNSVIIVMFIIFTHLRTKKVFLILLNLMRNIMTVTKRGI